MSFGARLKKARQEKKLTQAQLGEKVRADGEDAGKMVVSGWENDKHYPKVDELVKLCRKLRCSADYLVLGKEAQGDLTQEVAELAHQIDALAGRRREFVLRMCRDAVALAVNGSNQMAESEANEPMKKGDRYRG